MQVADQIQERESEFTGLKGQLLRYAGCTYVAVIVSRFIDGLAPQAGALSGALDNLAAAVFGAAFLVYPALLGVREMARIVREGREGRGEESAL